MEKVCSTAVAGKVREKGKSLLLQTLLWILILDDVSSRMLVLKWIFVLLGG